MGGGGGWLRSRERNRESEAERITILCEKTSNLKISGNEVYYTMLSILLVKIMLCSKLHCQIFFHCKPGHIKSLAGMRFA